MGTFLHLIGNIRCLMWLGLGVLGKPAVRCAAAAGRPVAEVLFDLMRLSLKVPDPSH